jgi:ABC-type transport system involved in cytochrome bd biosynthesis fused ATPase/permease subunit
LDAAVLAVIIERLFAASSRPTILMATHDVRLLALAEVVYDLSGGILTQRPTLRLVAS